MDCGATRLSKHSEQIEMARPRKPTALHVVQGTYRKDRHGAAEEPTPEALTAVPPVPPILGDHGEMEWRRAAEILLSVKVLTAADLRVLEAYCIAYETALDARTELRNEGVVVDGSMGGKIANPAASIQKSALAEMRACAVQLGLTPASRARLHVPKKNNDEKTDFGSLRRNSSRSKGS